MTLWLVRHAQPLIEPGVCYGRLDMPADAAANRVCAAVLAEALPRGIVISCSPLRRCEQLAHVLIGLRPDLTFKTDLRLQEMNFGLWEGKRWDAIDPADMAAWTENFAHHAAGASGESVSQLMSRVASAVDELPTTGADAIWITHAGVIRAARLLAQGIRQITRADQWPIAAPAYGQWETLNRLPG